MWYRKGIFVALAPVILLLPAWLLLTAGIVTADSGWDFLLYLVLAPIVGVALAIVALLTWLRASVRRERAVSTMDAVVFSAWWVAILVHGVAWTGELRGITAVLGVLLAITAFWTSIWQLVTAGRRSMNDLRERIEQQGGRPPGSGSGGAPGYDPGSDDGPIIRITQR